MSSLRNSLTIAGLSLLRVSRDRVALFFTFALPLMIITLLSAAVAGGDVVVGVARLDDGPLARELIASVEEGSVKLRTFDTVAALERAVRLERVQGGVVVPAGYDAAARADEAVAVTLLLDPTTPDSAAVRSKVGAAVAGQAAVVQAARFAASSADGPGFEPALDVARTQARGTVGFEVQTTTAGEPGVAGMETKDYATVGELVLFLFLIGLTSAGDLVQARRDGTARRMLATPTPPWAVIVGEGLGKYAILVVQATFIIVLGAGIFGVSWGDPVGVALVVATFALVGTSVSLLVGTLARSNEQATSIGPPVGIALAMLGGAMWPLEIVGPVMRAVGHLTPHAWALDAFVELIGNGVPASGVLPQVGVLVLFSAAVLPLAAFRLRRAIVA